MAAIGAQGDHEIARWEGPNGDRLVLTARGRLLRSVGRTYVSVRRGGTTLGRAALVAREMGLARVLEQDA